MTSDKINEAGDSQIVLYQPNESVKLEVKVVLLERVWVSTSPAFHRRTEWLF